MRVLITGARGFIGRAVTKAFLADESVKNVLCLSRFAENGLPESYFESDWILANSRKYDIAGDIKNFRLMRDYCSHFRPDVIVHLAANPLAKYNEQTIFGSVDTNITGTLNMLEAAPKGCRFLFASSATVYGDLGEHMYCNEESLTKPTSVYGVGKLAGEGMVSSYTDLGIVSGVSLRLVANVGPDSTHGAFHDIFNKIKDSNIDKLYLFGNQPGSIKPYMHVDDTAAAFLYMAKNLKYNGIFNVSPFHTFSIEDMANTMMEVMGIKKEIVWMGKASTWIGDNKKVAVDGAKLRVLLRPTHTSSREAVIAATKERL